jgi:hypothetical protein
VAAAPSAAPGVVGAVKKEPGMMQGGIVTAPAQGLQVGQGMQGTQGMQGAAGMPQGVPGAVPNVQGVTGGIIGAPQRKS